ncbi:BfmA/BtgA family mobilization protein [Pedobacter kyungheensis]|uniref:BfmA/BtgA family mobilization protein n=1 Tax=Pedobacter kyungheensis TaxID=1069985 RepID=UPI00068EE210|nr:BfmA/BtgA family mobilization protein [Pedobacter kyungheensis]
MTAQTKTFTKTVRFTETTNTKFNTLALKLGRDKRIVFEQMVDYFYKSKKDPLDLNDDLLKNTLLKNHNSYISFIKSQEADLLIPTKREIGRVVTALGKVLDAFNTEVLRHNELQIQGLKVLEKQQDLQVQKFVKLDSLMKTVELKLDTKEELKAKFMYILDNYIQIRDTFGITTSGIRRQELVDNCKAQIKKL